MGQLLGKWIPDSEIDASKIRFENNQALKARNFADDGDVEILKVDVNDKVVFGSVPQVTADPTANNDLVKKSWADTQLSGKLGTSLKGAASGLAELDVNSMVPVAQIPPAALERLIIVADQAARYALTIATAQNGDTVKQNDTGLMYFIKDDTELSNAAGYEQYTAGAASSVAWSGVTGKPTTLAGYGITDYSAAAKAAAVSDSLTDGIADVAPSQNAVFDALTGKEPANANIQSHIGSTSNPHSVTKSQVGLGSVTNDTQLKSADLDTDGTLAANSDTKIPSQKAVKTYADNVKPIAVENKITLITDDITNGYVDLTELALANSVILWPVGGLPQEPTTDYTLSTVTGKTRVTFAGNLALLLAAGDKLVVKYIKG